MKQLFDYCYYRIAKTYRAMDPNNYCDWGYWILFASFGFIILSMLTFLLHAFDKELNLKIIYFIAILVFIVDAFFSICISDKAKLAKFNRLEARYKNEGFRHLKGWLVFLYVIGSVASYFVTMILCGYWVDVQ